MKKKKDTRLPVPAIESEPWFLEGKAININEAFGSNEELKRFLESVWAVRRGLCPCLAWDKVERLFSFFGHHEVKDATEWSNITDRLHLFVLDGKDEDVYAGNYQKLHEDVEILLRAFHYERCRLNIGLNEARTTWATLRNVFLKDFFTDLHFDSKTPATIRQEIVSRHESKKEHFEKLVSLLDLFFKPIS